MGTTYRYLATVGEASTVLDWFRALAEHPTESRHEAGSLFYFSEFGPLNSDAKKSPVVNVIHSGGHVYPLWASQRIAAFFKSHSL